MKGIILIMTLFIASNAYPQIRSVSLQASGLTCSMCSRAIYKSLLKVPAVVKVTEDIQHSSYTIEFKEHEPIVLDDLRKAVKDAGFSMARMEVTADFNRIEIPADGTLHFGGVSFAFVGATARVLIGEKHLVLIDKDFLPEKERQKYLLLLKNTTSDRSGLANNDGNRIYHVIIRQS